MDVSFQVSKDCDVRSISCHPLPTAYLHQAAFRVGQHKASCPVTRS
jgi:hypothetical protein